uniref:Uncharacterized protein n=1 Tax=Corethron hystrix TaxID=216773 RepID=A0A7S1BB63_9STRA
MTGTEDAYDAELSLLIEVYGTGLLRTLRYEQERDDIDMKLLDADDFGHYTDLEGEVSPQNPKPYIVKGCANPSSPRRPLQRSQSSTITMQYPYPSISSPRISKKEWACRVRLILMLYVRSVPPHAVDSVAVGRFVLQNVTEALAREVLGIGWNMEVGDLINRGIKKIIRDYEHSSSFASLTFLHSPHQAAETHLRPLFLAFRAFLFDDAQDHFRSAGIETMLVRSIDPDLRRAMHNVEFTSLEHLLRVCKALKAPLETIELRRTVKGDNGKTDVEEEQEEEDFHLLTGKMDQALRDLQREVIWINGQPWSPGGTYEEIFAGLTDELTRGVSGKTKTNPNHDAQEDEKENQNIEQQQHSNGEGAWEMKMEWDMITMERLVQRLVLAASRTGVGGDAYFVIRDLFGGEGVVVAAAQSPSPDVAFVPGTVFGPAVPSRWTRGGFPTIEIDIEFTSLVIRCHSSFDILSEDGVDECGRPLDMRSEPLVQLHTTTTEHILLQQYRKNVNGSSETAKVEKEGDGAVVFETVLQERRCKDSGTRTLSIRPALYVKKTTK